MDINAVPSHEVAKIGREILIVAVESQTGEDCHCHTEMSIKNHFTAHKQVYATERGSPHVEYE